MINIKKENDKLISACNMGSIKYVNEALRNGAYIDVENGKPLELACRRDFVSIVNELVKNNATICIRKYRILETCIRYNSTKSFKLLLKKIQDPFVNDFKILYWTIKYKRIDMFEYIIKNNEKINFRSISKDFLRYAIKCKSFDFVDYLIKKYKIKTEIPIYDFFETGDMNIIYKVLKYVPYKTLIQETNEFDHIIQNIIHYGRINILKFIMNIGIEVNSHIDYTYRYNYIRNKKEIDGLRYDFYISNWKEYLNVGLII